MREWLRAHWADVLQALAILTGWSLLTWGIARLTVPELWLVSGGAFLLCLSGLGYLRMLFAAGVYALAFSDRKKADG